jgi:hypothetical protein
MEQRAAGRQRPLIGFSSHGRQAGLPVSSTAAPAAVFDVFPIEISDRNSEYAEDALDQIEGGFRVFLSDALR